MISVVLLIGCTGLIARWLWVHRAIDLGAEELNVCETVFRYQIEELQRGLPRRITVHYLTISDVNPPTALLERLRADNLSVERGSYFYWELLERGGWHFEIRELERVDPETFLVRGGYDNGPLSASGKDYTVVRRDGHWIVERVKGRWSA